MSKRRYAKLPSCVKGEQFMYTFKGNCKQYVALLTENQFESYELDINKIKRKLESSPCVLISDTNDDRLVIVRDLNEKNMPTEWSGTIRRFSPMIKTSEISIIPTEPTVRVKNAKDTDEDESMIQYWKDHKSDKATINLSNKKFRCPSCGKYVNTNELDGAHVVLVDGSKKKMYITPTCYSCNRSKVNRIFEVNKNDLVPAP